MYKYPNYTTQLCTYVTHWYFSPTNPMGSGFLK